ncbi:helix-turn-helix domain-containing protein [Candidatus Saccharibacteria bacterium CPR2]|nr:helix-turn-helix domain-containing protein [Candidatus Saccharibacteria bacterium CPR2]
MDTSELGKRIQEARKEAGFTQDDLSDRAGLAYSTLAKIERGAIKNPTFGTIAAIAQALNMSIDALAALPINKTATSEVIEDDQAVKFLYCDVNGVLVRFFQRAFTTLAREAGASPEKVESTFWHYNDAVCRGEMSVEEFNKAIAGHLRVQSVDWQKHYMNAVSPIKIVQGFLEHISSRVKIGLLTNIAPGFLGYMIEKKILPDLPYSAIVDSSIEGAIKPEPRIYEIAEKKARYSGNQILFVDDSRINLMAAEKRGWQVLWFDDYRPEESVERIRQAIEGNRS